MKFTYLLINFFTILFPLLFSFHPKIRFYKYWKYFFLAAAVVAVFFIVWDVLFTRWGVWSFNPDYVTGISIFNLPLEEVLFFICIPFACVFTYYCLDKFYKLEWKRSNEKIFCIVFSIMLLVLALINTDKLYTSITFASTGIVSMVITFFTRFNSFGKAITVYAVLLIPFFIVNGLLTGTGLQEPVVLYNDAENLGIRILTIPIEDSIYGFELVLLNLFLFQLFNGYMKPVKL